VFTETLINGTDGVDVKIEVGENVGSGVNVSAGGREGSGEADA
jgi:hypothetical protein